MGTLVNGHFPCAVGIASFTPASQTSGTRNFMGRMPFLPPNQRCYSTEGSSECSLALFSFVVMHITSLINIIVHGVWYHQPGKVICWPHPFYIHHQTSVGVAHNKLMPLIPKGSGVLLRTMWREKTNENSLSRFMWKIAGKMEKVVIFTPNKCRI